MKLDKISKTGVSINYPDPVNHMIILGYLKLNNTRNFVLGFESMEE